MWDWWWNINNNISFHFRLFPRKTNDKIFQKIQKNLFWGHLGPFLPRWGQKWIFLKKGICQFLDIPIIYHRAKNQKKNNERFLRWTPKWRIDRRTDNGDFIGRGSNNRNTRIRCEIWSFWRLYCLIWTYFNLLI